MTVVVDSLLLCGKSVETLKVDTVADSMHRGINEGRQAARDVDEYLMKMGTQLPKTGGIVQRADYTVVGRAHRMQQQAVAA